MSAPLTRLLAVCWLALAPGCDRGPAPRGGASGAPASAAGGSCDERERRWGETMRGSGAPSRACASDADCVRVGGGTGCGRGCDQALSKAGADDWRRRVEQVNEGPCKGFREAGCAVPEPSCAPLGGPPACRGGACVLPER